MNDESIDVGSDKFPKIVYCLPGENGKVFTNQAEIKEFLAKKKTAKLVRYRADRWMKCSLGNAKGLVIEDDEDLV